MQNQATGLLLVYRRTGTGMLACPAVCYGWFYTKRLGREKFFALQITGGNFGKNLMLSESSKADLDW